MYQIDEPIYFYLLMFLPLIWLGYLLLYRWKIKKQSIFADKMLMERLSPNRSFFKPLLKLLVISLSLIFLIFGLVNPKIGTELETVKREGVDIVFIVDVSKSMLAEDIAPNRLEKSKRLVSAIINQLVGDRV